MHMDAVDDVGEALLVLNDDDVQSTSPESTFTCFADNVVGNVTLTVRRVLRMWEIAADAENDEVLPRYTYINGSVAEMTGMDEHRLLIHQNRFSDELTTRSGTGSDYACNVLSKNRTDSSQSSSNEFCGGRDRRLRASSSLDGRGVQSSAGSDDTRKYGVEHLVAAVVVTVLVTTMSVVAAVAVCLRHYGHPTSAARPQHQQPITDNAARRTVSATTPVCDTVAHLTTKSFPR